MRTIFMENPMYFFNFSLHFFNLNGLKIDLIYKFERIFWLFLKTYKKERNELLLTPLPPTAADSLEKMSSLHFNNGAAW